MISYVALTPHPPVIVPGVGGDKNEEVSSTVEAMRDIAREILASAPETVVFLTPHGNVFADTLSYLSETRLRGDLGSFGHVEIGTSHPNDLTLLKEIELGAEQRGVSLVGISRETALQHRLRPGLDHGILVPLYFLEEAGLGDRPITAISVGFLDSMELYTFGRVIQEAAERLDKRIAIIASGDMSHRLKDEGPYDFHPDGSRFDQQIKTMLEKSEVQGILDIPEDLRRNAGECGYFSIAIMLGALDGWEFNTRIFNYQGPFGVGYLVAGLCPERQKASLLGELQICQRAMIEERRQMESFPVKWARQNLEDVIIKGKKPELSQEPPLLLREAAGAFVSIKRNGRLRGCMGTFQPTSPSLVEEIANNALAAGLRDPRFAPVAEEELPFLVYSVDILGEPEPCLQKDLDPHKYGVIVRSGSRSGLLLPDLEGVDTVEEQLAIALQKAGISPRESYTIERFEVQRFT